MKNKSFSNYEKTLTRPYNQRCRILKNEDIWLNTQAIAELFNVNDKVIYKHIANIYEQKELEEVSTFSILETIGKNGHKYKTKYYNLDMSNIY